MSKKDWGSVKTKKMKKTILVIVQPVASFALATGGVAAAVAREVPEPSAHLLGSQSFLFPVLFP